MRRLLLLPLIVVPLVAAPSAGAKGFKWVELCGPVVCKRTPGTELESTGPLVFPPWVMSGRPDEPPAHAGRWLRVRVAVPRSHRRLRSVVIPGRGYAGGDQGGGHGYVWQRLGDAELRTYRRLGRGLERFPAADLTCLAPASRPAADTAAAAPADRPLSLVVGSVFERIRQAIDRPGAGYVLTFDPAAG